jgi:biopolymer transport protein ExbD
MNIRRKLKAHSEIHTGPLNDILFILLLFFLIAATLANPKKVNLPKGTKDTKARQSLVVSIDKDQNFYVGTQKVDPAMVDSVLKQQIELQRKNIDTPTVVINADTISYSGRMFQVMRIVRDNNAKFVFAIRQ